MFDKKKNILFGLMLLAMAGSAIAAQFARPDGTISPGAPNPWTAAGAATLHEATDEAAPNDDADYRVSI